MGGRFLLLRILLGTVTLVACTVASVFWVRSLNDEGAEEERYDLPAQRSMALNTLSFAAMAVTISARFAYNSSFHPRIFFNNQLCWWSILIMGGLQVFITYTPGINMVIFQMGPMDLFQWLIVVVFFFVT